MSTIVSSFPQELLSAICAAVYDAANPAPLTSLDPLLQLNDPTTPTHLPSSYPPGNWAEPLARSTLNNLSLVSHAWRDAAKPFLWRKVEVRLPRTWLAFVEEVGFNDNEEISEIDSSLSHATSLLLASKLGGSCGSDSASLHRMGHLSSGPKESIPPELLSPPASRDPSPARLPSKSPARWRPMYATNDTPQSLEPDVYVPAPYDPRPGRHVRHIDFNHFRTIGMRRSVGEGVNSRFVTAERVESVLREMPNLRRFGATEYMDGALNKAVLVELLLRGKAFPELSGRGRRRAMDMDTMHTQVRMDDSDESRERRREYKELEALDLCGCVSSVFVQALDEFVHEYLEGEILEDGTHGSPEYSLPGIKRLGMRGVTSVPSAVLTPFVLACTHLTHLDLSGTRCTPDLLQALADSPDVHLKALALSRCTRLDGESIVDFLVNSSAARDIEQLSLYGDGTFSSSLSKVDLDRLITEAPCFKSGNMDYLDLSSTPLTAELLQKFSPQNKLRSLGLSYIPDLSLSAIANFVLNIAPNTEVLTLVSTSPELGLTVPWRQLAVSIHGFIIRPLATSPFKFSLEPNPKLDPPPTRLRVIELGTPTLQSLGAGADSWRIVKSKGGRGWYVHSASAWVNGELRRDLSPNHPVRMEVEHLAAANGNVNSGVGWHARKMEVLHGLGMVGREDGLYGAVSFAYQG